MSMTNREIAEGIAKGFVYRCSDYNSSLERGPHDATYLTRRAAYQNLFSVICTLTAHQSERTTKRMLAMAEDKFHQVLDSAIRSGARVLTDDGWVRPKSRPTSLK